MVSLLGSPPPPASLSFRWDDWFEATWPYIPHLCVCPIDRYYIVLLIINKASRFLIYGYKPKHVGLLQVSKWWWSSEFKIGDAASVTCCCCFPSLTPSMYVAQYSSGFFLFQDTPNSCFGYTQCVPQKDVSLFSESEWLVFFHRQFSGLYVKPKPKNKSSHLERFIAWIINFTWHTWITRNIWPIANFCKWPK